MGEGAGGKSNPHARSVKKITGIKLYIFSDTHGMGSKHKVDRKLILSLDFFIHINNIVDI